MASGITGQPLRDVHGKESGGYMFFMPLVYRQLKHVTHSKMQARGTGAKKIDTGQPVGGRQREGAPRFGRMEARVISGHGAFEFLSDRLCKSSDAFESVVCQSCGKFALVDVVNERFKCTLCDKESRAEGFNKVILPFIGVNIGHQLASAGINMRLYIKEQDKDVISSGMYDDI